MHYGPLARRTRNPPWILLAVALLVGSLACARTPASDLPGAGADSGGTVLYRDTWGVPHIYAPTIAAGLYAQGWL